MELGTGSWNQALTTRAGDQGRDKEMRTRAENCGLVHRTRAWMQRNQKLRGKPGAGTTDWKPGREKSGAGIRLGAKS